MSDNRYQVPNTWYVGVNIWYVDIKKWYVDVVYGMWVSYMVCGVSTNGKELFRGRLHGDQVKVLEEAAVGALL